MPRIPGYCLHKPSGRAVVNCKALFGDKPFYIDGPYGSPESRAKYEEIRAQIVALKLGTAAPAVVRGAGRVTLGEVFFAFLAHAEQHYDRREFLSFRSAVRVANGLHAKTLANHFGPVALKEVRAAMIAKGWARTHVNHQVNRLRLIVKWAVGEELADESSYYRLKAVESLRAGKSAARETAEVQPVAWEVASQISPFVPPVVRAMIEVQYLTGMRSDELTAMRPCELERHGEHWTYQPATHKNRWRGGAEKIICLGPRAQQLLAPYLGDDPNAFIFSPAQALSEHGAMRAAARKTKPYGKSKSRTSIARQRLRERYTANSYAKAVKNGLRKMAKLPGERRAHEPKGVSLAAWLAERGVQHWHPHQLRHTRATLTRAAYGVEGAQAQLGNTLEATQIYAQKSLQLALRIAAETG